MDGINNPTVKEFGIYSISKFIRDTVLIDRSSEELSKLSVKRSPIFQEEQLFLKVLVEGKASLFQFTEGNLIRFFFNINSSEIKQLVYKSYLINPVDIKENTQFRQMLMQVLTCPDISESDVSNTDYKKNDLPGLFVKYNECENSNYVNFDLKKKRDAFNLTLRPGINYSSLSLYNVVVNSRDFDFNKNWIQLWN